MKRERDESAALGALSRLEEVARGTENTMPAILECVEALRHAGRNLGRIQKGLGRTARVLAVLVLRGL